MVPLDSLFLRKQEAPPKARQLVLKVHEVPIVFDGDAGDEEPVVNTFPFCTHSFP